MKPKPEIPYTPQPDNKKKAEKPRDESQTDFEKLKAGSQAMDALSQALLDKLIELIPLDAKEMTSETTLTVGSVAIDFKFRMKRDKPKEAKNNHVRSHLSL